MVVALQKLCIQIYLSEIIRIPGLRNYAMVVSGSAVEQHNVLYRRRHSPTQLPEMQ
jgi:hypothetical protein